MKLVLDTNVVLAAVLVPGLCRELLAKHLHGHELWGSKPLLAEFADKLLNKFGEPPEESSFFCAYRDRLRMIEPVELPKPVCRDPDDDMVLATAIAAQANAIISGNKDLLVIKRYAGVAIVSPRQFLEVIA